MELFGNINNNQHNIPRRLLLSTAPFAYAAYTTGIHGYNHLEAANPVDETRELAIKTIEQNPEILACLKREKARDIHRATTSNQIIQRPY